MFLVMIRCVSDDIPIRIFLRWEEAKEYADKMNPDTYQDIKKLFVLKPTEPHSVVIVEFEYGVPINLTLIRDLTK